MQEAIPALRSWDCGRVAHGGTAARSCRSRGSRFDRHRRGTSSCVPASCSPPMRRRARQDGIASGQSAGSIPTSSSAHCRPQDVLGWAMIPTSPPEPVRRNVLHRDGATARPTRGSGSTLLHDHTGLSCRCDCARAAPPTTIHSRTRAWCRGCVEAGDTEDSTDPLVQPYEGRSTRPESANLEQSAH